MTVRVSPAMQPKAVYAGCPPAATFLLSGLRAGSAYAGLHTLRLGCITKALVEYKPSPLK